MRQAIAAAAAFALVVLTGACATMDDPQPNPPRHESAGVPTGFIDKRIDAGGRRLPYVVYVPRDYDASEPWPVVLFLHGLGERGDDGLKPTEVGIGRAIRLDPDRFPAIVIFPQCPADTGWWEDDGRALLGPILQATLDAYHTDLSRVYLTGLSMGGYGTWLYGADRPETFAALMPICGGGDPRDATALAQTPIWAFHGAADQTVEPEQSREMVRAVREAGGEVKYTEYPGVGHNSWDEAYANEDAIAWLFKQQRTPE